MGIESVKSQVKEKAKKQIDEIIEKMKTKDFLQVPAIQSLIEKVSAQKTDDKIIEISTPVDEGVQTMSENNSDNNAPQSNKKKKSKTSASQLLDIIKTTDVANRIAQSVLDKAEDLSSKFQHTVDEIKEKSLNVVEQAKERVAPFTGKVVKSKKTKVASKAKKSASSKVAKSAKSVKGKKAKGSKTVTKKKAAKKK